MPRSPDPGPDIECGIDSCNDGLGTRDIAFFAPETAEQIADHTHFCHLYATADDGPASISLRLCDNGNLWPNLEPYCANIERKTDDFDCDARRISPEGFLDARKEDTGALWHSTLTVRPGRTASLDLLGAGIHRYDVGTCNIPEGPT